MPRPELPQATERRRAAQRVLERALLVLLLLCLLRRAAGRRPGDVPAPVVPPPVVVDVARAPEELLTLLPGIGPARARALLRHRARHGPPRTLTDLLAVPGIGPARLDALRNAREVCVTCQGAAVAGPPPQGGVDSAHERAAGPHPRR